MGRTVRADPKNVDCEFSPEALLQAVIAVSDDAIFTLDSRGFIATWSATSERLFGFRAGEVLEGPFYSLFPEHLHAEVWSVVSRAFAGEPIKHFESEVVRTDGMPMPVWISLCPINDSAGVTVAAAVIAKDVTEQRLAQASLAEVEARLEEGESLAHVGSWLWDLRTGTTQWSSEFHRMHGVDPLDFDGTFDFHLSVIHPADRSIVREAMERSVESGRPFESEYRVIRTDQQVRVLHVRAQPTIGSAGTAVGLRGIGKDVTEQG
jgi:PAS domain S-box-containing protein